jgi:hypothetical protein
MLTKWLAVGMVAGGIYALSGAAEPARAAPAGLAAVGDTPSAVTDVRRHGGGFGRGGIGRGRGFGGRGFVGRGFGGGRAFHGGRRFAGRGFYGGRRFYGGRHYGFRRHRGRNLFLYGALPFIGYQAYTGYGYGRGCGRYWHRYRVTGSRYWYRRWWRCRHW